MRLTNWRLSPGGETFAYGGDEVELSVWNTEAAFAKRPEDKLSNETKKRKRGDQLLPGEIWRAKNVPHDGLSLRQPVKNTSLAYLQPAGSTSHCHILAGTQQGNVRRYDTRAARRPVADWKGIAKIGGISTIEKGHDEHEAFVADHGCNLFALDLRNGRVSYGYRGLAGSVMSMAPSPSFLASVSQDRFLRLHSTFPPPAQAGSQQEQKGNVVDKQFMKTNPTVIVWDQFTGHLGDARVDSDTEDGADDAVWDAMQNVEDVDEEEEGGQKRKRGRKPSHLVP
ncbi:uncharacterized protein FIBRA_01167 [Fibroporia radiculosa]|uniref:Ribosome biogenesis protein NSA1 n=1 Tax=Fibroporia radiculosa TaxID=599839 RepID=J4HSV6_9APHY|nr:uncharacterized protein FIBRA_01167 [Fibroporia radiculosa]CCL99152.1 predicted protein [Fibroporia radiculosa]